MAPPAAQRRSLSGASVAVLIGLLVLPVLALLRLPVDAWLSAAYALCASLVTYAVYRHDKARAEARGWRVPEATLHVLELIGGWPGAFLAQRRLRHKIAKRSYQAVFWAIVLLHQVVACESLQDWKFSRRLLGVAEARGAR